jgi:transporter family-2 protein
MLAKIFYSVFALAAGIAFATQSGVNAALARNIGSSLLAAMISFCVGFIALTGLAFATGQLPFAGGATRDVPLWMWISGGLMGAGIIYSSIFLVPRIGVAALAAFIIAGQLTAASIIDHFGLLGVPVHEMSVTRAIGLALLLCGAVLVRFA